MPFSDRSARSVPIAGVTASSGGRARVPGRYGWGIVDSVVSPLGRAVGERSGSAAARPSRGGSRTPSWSSAPSGGGSPRSTSCGSCAQAEACTRPGEIGALLRREGLYTSHLTAWRKQRDAGALEALERPRGRKPADPRDARDRRAARRAERAEAELEKARQVIEVQGNVSALLGRAARAQGRARRAPSDDRADRRRAHADRSAPGRRAGRWAPSPATIYRRRRPPAPRPRGRGRRRPGRSPSPSARRCWPSCTRERFVDSSPAQVWATLLDEGSYLASRAHDVPAAGRRHGQRPRAARPAHPSRLRRRPSCSPSGPTRSGQLGHHQAQGPGEVDLLLPLRDPRRLQPLRRRLDRPAPRDRPSSPRR